MKRLILSTFIIAIAFTAGAQSNLRFSIGAEVGAATGNLNTVYSLAIGGTAQVDYMMSENAAITANAGVIEFVGRKITGTNLKYRSEALIPLLAGAKYYFTPQVYGSGQLGVSLSTATGGGSSFTYAPGIGYKFDNRLDALLKYTGYSSNGGTFGIRLAYTF